jgi:hypothetical protein
MQEDAQTASPHGLFGTVKTGVAEMKKPVSKDRLL